MYWHIPEERMSCEAGFAQQTFDGGSCRTRCSPFASAKLSWLHLPFLSYRGTIFWHMPEGYMSCEAGFAQQTFDGGSCRTLHVSSEPCPEFHDTCSHSCPIGGTIYWHMPEGRMSCEAGFAEQTLAGRFLRTVPRDGLLDDG